ncbi:MAG TPA: nuclear transport factor 2 family protein [Candidatus Kapabacteria bacterium]|nr:nuclear transport factor 2 family protein [Candidatus Kapabacteria bacterium]
MTQDKINGMYRAIDTLDAKGFVANFTDDAKFIIGNDTIINGKDNILKYIEEFFNSINIIRHFDMKEIVKDDVVVVYGSSQYTRKDGSFILVPFCDILEVWKGQIKQYHIYNDLSKL